MNITISNTLLNAQTAHTKHIINEVVKVLTLHYELNEKEAIGHVMDNFSLEVKPKKQKQTKDKAVTEKITKEVISDASNPLIPPAAEPKAEAEKPKAEKVKEPKVKEPKVKEPKVKEPKVKEPKVKEPKSESKKIIKQEIIIDDGQEYFRILIPDATHKKNDILNKDNKKVIGQYNEEEKIIEYFEEDDDELSDIEEEEEEE